MPARPFDKIAAGLNDAIAFARGDESKGHFATPRNELDAAARRAFAAAARLYDIADWHAVNPRTVERIAKGRRDVPPGLGRAVALQLDAINGDDEPDIAAHARALEEWANSREPADG